MLFYFGIDNHRLSLTRDGAALTTLTIPTGGVVPLEVAFYDSAGCYLPAPTGLEIKFGITDPEDSNATLALASTWVSDNEGRYTSTLDTRTAELVAALGTAYTLETDGGFFIKNSSFGPLQSQNITVTLDRNTVTEDGDTPTSLPSADDWLTARAVRFDTEQTLSEGEQEQARENIGVVGVTVDNTTVNAAIATNPGATRTALDLGSAALADTGDFAAALGADDNYVTDAQIVVIGNTSGTNSGDNAANSTYTNDYRAANFVAGTDYLAPSAIGSTVQGFSAILAGTTASFTTAQETKLGYISITQAVDLDAVESHTTNTSNPHSVTKSQVGLGNVENTALSTWTGGANITTLGTIGTGTWQATIIAPAYLGTGSSISTKYLRGDGTWQTIGGGGDALTSGTLDQFADVTQTGGATLAITASTTLNGGTHSGTNTGDQTTITGNAGTATALETGRSIYGNTFDGTADLTQVITAAFGGTNNGFTAFTGPATSTKTFTLPNASATILTSNAAVTVAQGGTGRATSTTAYGLLAAGTTATGAHQTLSAGATTTILVGGGASALPVWTTATGSGAPVRATSPTLVTPVLGTPTSGNLSNCTALNATQLTSGTIPAARFAPYWVEVVLTGSGADIAAGAKVAMVTHMQAGTITGFKLVCDPAAEPTSTVDVDLNSINLSTGAATSRLSAVASIASGANVSTGGTISGTQTVAVGDQSSFDIDQGSDGKELRALIQITPT